jgi:hypothetical protein
MVGMGLGAWYGRVLGRAFGYAKVLLSPDDAAYQHPQLELIKRVRAIGGVVITLAVAVTYNALGLSTVLTPLNNVIINCAIGLGSLATGLIVYAVRNRGVAGTGRPARRTLFTAAGMAVVIAILPLTTSLTATINERPILHGLVIIVVVVGFVLPIVLRCAYLAFLNMFNVADTHPLLPALCTAIYAGAMVPYNAVLLLVAPADPRIPLPVSIALMFGGPALVLLLCIVEMRLAAREGLRLRASPRPAIE